MRPVNRYKYVKTEVRKKNHLVCVCPVHTGHWVLGTEHWALGTGHLALGTGHWALDTGHQTLEIVSHPSHCAFHELTQCRLEDIVSSLYEFSSSPSVTFSPPTPRCCFKKRFDRLFCSTFFLQTVHCFLLTHVLRLSPTHIHRKVLGVFSWVFV